MPSCEQNRKTVDIAGTNWFSYTTILGWPVKAIWPEGASSMPRFIFWRESFDAILGCRS
jgi:hypothetical protein